MPSKSLNARPPFPGYDYWAFISYSHKDAKWARFVSRKLEGFKIPRQVRKDLPDLAPDCDHLSPVFLDDQEMGAGTGVACPTPSW